MIRTKSDAPHSGRQDHSLSWIGVDILAQPDITLVLDKDAVIRDVTVSNTVAGEFVKTWLGRPWIDTVADSGVDKVQSSLDDALAGGVSAYRRILQRFPSGLELPIEYTTVRLGDSGGMVAVGRNLQASSELQSRLIAAQQAMERDYWKLREVETRYRLLFDASNEAVLVLGLDDLHVVEANPAAIRALGLTSGWAFLDEVAPEEHGSFRAMLERVRDGGRVPGGIFHLGAQQAPWILRASLMNDNAASFYMLQLAPVDGQRALATPEPVVGMDIVQHVPDCVVVIDPDGVGPERQPGISGDVEGRGCGRDHRAETGSVAGRTRRRPILVAVRHPRQWPGAVLRGDDPRSGRRLQPGRGIGRT